MKSPLRVLALARSYPNPVLPNLGLWTERLVRHTLGPCQARVIAPVPYCPPLPLLPEYTRFRTVPHRREENGLTVYHPRILLGPGQTLYNFEALAYYLGIRKLVARLRAEFPFDLIHAHFSYPDGVVAAWLGRRFGVPVLVTEHAPWEGWMDRHPLVRRQTVSALREIAFHIAVSRSVQTMIARFTGSAERLRVIPNGVDGAVFHPPAPGEARDPNQILFVGFINYNKGVDTLLRAMQRLAERCPKARLVLVGGGFYRNTRLQEEQLRQLASELGLADRVRFVGPRAPAEVARWMRQSALLVLPSRAESFGAVLVEALACGTPVLATRCGGPEDIVHEDNGLLVPPGDVAALADGIERVLQTPRRYDPARLRAAALERFSWERVAADTVELYRQAVGEPARDGAGRVLKPVCGERSLRERGACSKPC